MRILKNLILMTLLLTIVSCQHNHKYIQDEYLSAGDVSCLLNGEPRLFQDAVVFLDEQDNVSLSTRYSITGGPAQTLTIRNIKRQNGVVNVYDIIEWSIYDSIGKRRGDDSTFAWYYLDYGDVGAGSFNLLESEDNYLTINNYNSNSPKLTGTFQLTFVRSKPYSRAESPELTDTIRLTNGKIDVNITKYHNY